MNTILFLGHQQVSHAFDTFFDGCVRLLGRENVYEYPILDKYHCTSIYDASIPHDDIQPVYGWWCRNTIPVNTNLSLLEWSNAINNLRIKYIVGSNRVIDNFIELLKLIDDSVLDKICIVFIEEEHDLEFGIHRQNLEKLKLLMYKIDIFYKMDYIQGRVGEYKNIYPFYMSAPVEKLLHEVEEIKAFSKREIDVCYIAYEGSHPIRIIYGELLDNLNIGNNLISYKKHKYSLKQYFDLINNSKIFISVRGNEWSNTRNVEGPFLGAGLFSEELDITIPYEYQDGESAIFFNRETLIPHLIGILCDTNKMEELAISSRKHCLNYHTTIARAQQFLDLAKNIKGWQ